MEVLTSILKQGAEFNSLADTALADRYNTMLELVTEESPEGDFPIMMALINSVPQEHVVREITSLCIIYDGSDTLIRFCLSSLIPPSLAPILSFLLPFLPTFPFLSPSPPSLPLSLLPSLPPSLPLPPS